MLEISRIPMTLIYSGIGSLFAVNILRYFLIRLKAFCPRKSIQFISLLKNCTFESLISKKDENSTNIVIFTCFLKIYSAKLIKIDKIFIYHPSILDGRVDYSDAGNIGLFDDCGISCRR